jgi:hypothetical protein
MNNHFAIVDNRIACSEPSLYLVKNSGCYNVYCSSSECFDDIDDLVVFLKGYVVPRNNIFDQFKKHGHLELIKELFSQHGNEFVNYIKGNFIVVIIVKDEIKIFTDHFGLNSCFYKFDERITAFSDSIDLLNKVGVELVPDNISLATKSIIHRNIPGFTLYKGIYQTTPASYIKLNKNKFIISNYWTHDTLLKYQVDSSRSHDFAQYADFVKTNFNNFVSYLKPEAHTITLTGGKDSRTGLAALKSVGITPYGFTYGNKDSIDAVYARNLAGKITLEHYVFYPTCSEDWFDQITDEIISFGNPEISIHRAHRLNAFREMSQVSGPKSAYYAGYMAGEFLMGAYYDNLIFTKFLTDFWDHSTQQPLEPILKKYFHVPDSVHLDDILERISKLKALDLALPKEMHQFYGMFEIGVPHHGQDIFLAGQYFDYVYPFFIDIDFLEALFTSPYSFFFTDNKSKNLLKRYKLFELNLNIQHILCPQMDDILFGKRGSYNSKEFLRGRLYWSLVKSLRYIFQRQKYPPSFVYDSSFIKFLLTNLKALQNDANNMLHEFYDVPKAISQISNVALPAAEGSLHRFSNIVMCYRQMLHYGKN